MKQKIYFITFLILMFTFFVNIKAYTIFENDVVKYDEEKIIDIFEVIEGFDIEEYSNIVCMKDHTFSCLALTDNTKDTMYKSGTSYSGGRVGVAFSGNYCSFTINDYKNNYKMNGTQGCKNLTNANHMIFTNTSSSYMSYSNFNIPPYDSTINQKINVLDFSKYSVNLQFNDNLFINNSDFKKVCVNSNSSFSITKKHEDGIKSGSDHDFIWFPYGISGIKKFNYSTEMSNGYYEFENPYENFYFSSYDAINSIWNTEYMANNFESKGYTDKYQYYGYTAYLFLHWYNFNEDQTYNFFPIFELTDNVTTTHISSSGSIHGGSGLRLDGDEEIEISNEYCFYIKKEYEVNEVILDEWGDHYVSVNTPNGPINYGTTINKDKTNTDSFLSQPIKFLNEIKDTISFINSLIYEFYMSLPVLLRTFIITTLIILIVMLIMKIGGYK